jgi:hypothetical protein
MCRNHTSGSLPRISPLICFLTKEEITAVCLPQLKQARVVLDESSDSDDDDLDHWLLLLDQLPRTFCSNSVVEPKSRHVCLRAKLALLGVAGNTRNYSKSDAFRTTTDIANEPVISLPHLAITSRDVHRGLL